MCRFLNTVSTLINDNIIAIKSFNGWYSWNFSCPQCRKDGKDLQKSCNWPLFPFP